MKLKKWGMGIAIFLAVLFSFTGCQSIPQVLFPPELPEDVQEYSLSGLEQMITESIYEGGTSFNASFRNDQPSLPVIIKDDAEWIETSNYLCANLLAAIEVEVVEERGYTDVTVNITYQEGEQPQLTATTQEELIDSIAAGLNLNPRLATVIIENPAYTDKELFTIFMTAEVNSGLIPTEPRRYSYESFDGVDNRQIYQFSMEVPYSDEEIAIKKEELTNSVKTAAASIVPGDPRSMYEQIYYYVMNAAEYDFYLLEMSQPELLTDEMLVQRSAYGALVQGSTVCTGYARAFKAICDELGLPCQAVTGTIDGEGHMWNMVSVDGILYYVDCTFGDTGAPYGDSFMITFDQLNYLGYVFDGQTIVPQAL